MNNLSLIYIAASVPRLLIFLVYGVWIYSCKYSLRVVSSAPNIDNYDTPKDQRTTFHIIVATSSKLMEGTNTHNIHPSMSVSSTASAISGGGQSSAGISSLCGATDSVVSPVHTAASTDNSNGIGDAGPGIRMVHSVDFVNQQGAARDVEGRFPSLDTVSVDSVGVPQYPGGHSLTSGGGSGGGEVGVEPHLPGGENEGGNWLYAFPRWVRRHRLLPRYWYGHSGGAQLSTSSAFGQYATAVLFVIILVVVGNTLENLAESFRNHSAQKSKFVVYIVYTFACIVFKVLIKRIGLLLDAGKVGGLSIFFLAEFLGVMFYFSFYRMLFEDAVSWELFVGMQLFHFGCEWLMYGLRFTKCLYGWLDASPDSFISLRTLLMLPGLTYYEWQSCLLFEFCTRVYCAIFSAICYCVLLMTTARTPWVESALKPVTLTALRVPLLQLLACVFLEAVNAYVMYKIVRTSFRSSGWEFVKIIANRRFCLLCFVYGICIMINPFAGFQEYLDHQMTTSF